MCWTVCGRSLYDIENGRKHGEVRKTTNPSCRSHFELPPPSELVVPLLDLGLRFWPRPPSNTPPLDLALSIARTDPPLGLVRLLACRRRSSAPSSTVSSLRNLTERFLEISRRRVFIGDDAREVAPSSRDARAFLGAASPGAGAGAAVAGAGAAAAAQPKLLHFDDGQRERVAICRTRRCAS